MKTGPSTARTTAKELTLSAIENHLIPTEPGDGPEEIAKKVLAFYNTIADGLTEED